METLLFGHAGWTKIIAEDRIFWCPSINKEIEDRTKNCADCMSSGKSLNYQILKNETGKSKTLTGPGQKIQIDFSGKLNNKKLNGEHQILIAVDKFSTWLTVKICKPTDYRNKRSIETKIVICTDFPRKSKRMKHSYRKNTKNFAKHETSK